MSKFIFALYILTTSLALIVLKYGTKTGLPISYINNKLQFNLSLYTVGGIILYMFSFITYVYLISKYDLGYIIPLAAAFVYIVIFIASAIVFNETFTAVKVSGIALIIVGLVLLNLNK